MHRTVQGTISIVSHGHGDLVRHLLRDLASQRGIEDWHVVLTLNIPEKFGEDDLAGLNATIVRNDTMKGFGENHNAAARIAHGALFAIVNPDIRLPAPDTLQELAAAEWHDPAPMLRAPIVVAPDGTREDSVRRNLSLPNLIARSRNRNRAGWEADPAGTNFFWLAGMFLVAPLDTFRSLGGFDERFRLYCEDYDLSARWRLAGGGVQVMPTLQVVHDARRDSHRSFRHMKWHVTSLLRVWTSATFWKTVAAERG